MVCGRFEEAKSKARIKEDDKSNDKRIEKLLGQLSRYEKAIEESTLLEETIQTLKEYPITHIRCLALGSPSDSIPALYQLAFLMQICRYFKVATSNVSLYDPVFNDIDTHLIEHIQKYSISEQDEFSVCNTLYFLPHASLELTEVLLKESKPLWLLGNNIMSHTDRLTKRKLHTTYGTISLLVHLLGEIETPSKENDGFISVSAKKKKRNRKPIFKEPEIDYNYESCYFEKATLTQFKCINGAWGNSFSDLAFHSIIRTTEAP